MNDSSFERDGDHVAPGIEPGRLTRADLVRRAAVAGVAVPAAAWAATGARTAAAATRKGGTLRVAMIKPGAAIDPVSGFDFGSIATGQMVADYLAWVEPGGRLRPVLATSWHSDSMARKWTFKLRPDVRFSNGRPLAATDVVATFDRLTSPKIGNATLKGILSPGKTKRVDDHTVVFNLDRPFVDFPTLVAVSNYNAVILPADWPGDFEKNPIGTGPFLLDQIVPGQSVSFKRNPNYWRKGLPLLDGVLFRFYAENQPQVLALQGGDVDMMIETPFQGSQALFNNPKITILSATSASHRALHMRVDKEPWTDKRVRQALAFTIDRDKLVQALFQGKAAPGNDHIFSPAFGVPVRVPKRTQNYSKAKHLLDAAGHGGGLQVTLTTENYLEIPQLVTIVKQMAKPAGIDIKLEIEDQGKYYGSGKNQPWLDVPLGLVDWGNRPVPSPYINLAYRCGAIWNSAHWCNKTFTKLAAQYDATVNKTKRLAIATQMAKIMQDETPAIIPYWIPRLRAISKRVHGVKADPSGNLDLSTASIG